MEINAEQIKNKVRLKTKSVVILTGSVIILFFIAIIANNWFNKQQIRNININGNSILSKAEVHSIIDNLIMNVKNDGLNLYNIEKKLNSNEYIQSSEVFINSKGVLGINITEKKPIAIIINEYGTPKLIDKYSNIFNYRLLDAFIGLPIINANNININNKNKIQNAVNIIQTLKNKFPNLETKISEITCNKTKNEYFLQLTYGNISANIGDTDNLINKLETLQTFIDNVILTSNDISIYKQLDARWKDKIIINE